MRISISGCTLFAAWLLFVLDSAHAGYNNQHQMQHRRSTSRNANTKRKPRPGPTQIPFLLTDERCRLKQFRSLRACRLNARQASQLSTRYLCETRDLWIPQQQPPQRSKRTINACGGTRIRQAILEALDSDGNLRELVIDRANNLYQTIFVESCSGFGGVSGLSCVQHPITFKAAVFDLDPSSNDVSVVDVSTAGYCALSF